MYWIESRKPGERWNRLEPTFDDLDDCEVVFETLVDHDHERKRWKEYQICNHLRGGTPFYWETTYDLGES